MFRLASGNNPVLDRNKLAQIVVFNYLIGNNDAHGKNFSLLHRSLKPAYSGVNYSGAEFSGRIESYQIELAPLYDVLLNFSRA